jgi:PAS domain S-box-containing protein
MEAERRRVQAERDQLASIAETAPDLTVVGRTDGRLVWMNSAGRTMLRFARTDDIGQYRIEDLFSAQEMARRYAEDMQSLARDGDWQGEWTLQARDGTEIPVWATLHLHRDGQGEPTHISGVMRDLRPQRAEERSRWESERRLAAAEGVAGTGSWEWDPASNTVMWSPGMYRLHAMEPGDGVESFDAWVVTLHPEDRERVLEQVAQAHASGTGVDFQYRAFRKDGREIVMHSRGELVRADSGRETMLGTVLDITAQHAVAEALRESEEQARSVIATAGDAYVQFGPDGLVSEWNGQAEKIFGWAGSEVLGRALPTLVLAAGERESFERRVGLRVGHESAATERFETIMVHRSGREIPVEVTAWSTNRGNKPVFNCFVRDISERRAAERAKDDFLSVVGHELRTPLTSIHGALGLLRAGLLGDLSERGQRMVDLAAHNTDRLVRLINDILDIERLNSGKIPLQRERCDLAALAARCLEGMRPMADASSVRLEIDAQPVTVWADPDRLEQTFTNLLSNAIKFSPADATVRLVVQADGGEATVQVHDRGRGIPPEHLELVFDRFQQVDGSDAREKGGTGLGLAICRTIVEQHGGRIWAESGAGAGTTLTFTLPTVSWGLEPPGGGPTVLVCDDDPAARDAVADMLRAHGYDPVGVAAGDRLLDAALRHRPAVILLDLDAPGTDDWHAAAGLRERRETRDIPVVVLSLHGANADEAGSSSGGSDDRIDASTLIAAVTRAIDSTSVGPTLLLVEDDQDLADVLAEGFRHLGIGVRHASTARGALALSKHFVPDLLVLDLLLPDQDGYAVVAQLRRDVRFRGMPLAVYTAYDLSEVDRQRLRLGETRFFTKGRVTPDTFERHVVDLLRQLTTAPLVEGPAHA